METGESSRFSMRAFLFSLAALLSLALLALTAPRWSERLDLAVFDSFMRTEPRAFDPETPVRIVDIDSESLAAIGQWPWPRTYIAEMIRRLQSLGAAVVAFDVVFAEPDRTSPERIGEAWRRYAADLSVPEFPALPDHDDALAQAIGGAPVVLGTILTHARGARPGVKASFSHLGPDPRPHLPRFAGAEVNLPELGAAAAGIGAITLSQRSGGIVRSAPLLAAVGTETTVPLLAVEALRVAMQRPGYLVKSVGASGERGTGGMVSLRVGAFEIPTEGDGSIWIRFSQPDPRRVVSARRIMGENWRDPALEAEIAGRLIFVGTGAPGLRDTIATPLGDNELGVTVHAQLAEQIVAGDYLTRPDWARGLELVLMGALGLMLAAVTAFARPIPAFAIAAIAALAAFVVSWWGFSAKALLLGPVWPASGALVAWGVGALVKFAQTEQEKRAVRSQFSHFLAPEVVDEIARDPARYLRPGGEDRELTILFCDVRQFSTISKDMSPQELIAYLNDFLTPMTEVIVEHGGTIDKYMGDAIMAFWNAPKPREDHRARAVSAALAMETQGRRLNTRLRQEGRPPLAFGIGLNTGTCSVGSIGSRRRLDYTCIGDPVNVASRLEGLTKQYGVTICAAESVIEGARDVAAIELDTVTVVGREDRHERIFTVLGGEREALTVAFRTARETAADALAAYRAQEFERAEAAFRSLSNADDALAEYARTLLTRIAELRAAPPGPGWDGVYRSQRK